jgi:signal transduction histidine kinase
MEQQSHLQELMGTLENTIEAPDQDDHDYLIPDIVDSRESKGRESFSDNLEWFDPAGHLIRHKGALNVAVPFDKNAEFQTQENQHILLLTRAMHREGKTFGYLRVGTPLEQADLLKKHLREGLAVGTLLASVLSGLAILFLVRQALKPVASTVKLLSEFTSNASHELQSPVTAIKTNCDVALKYPEGMRPGDHEKIEAIKNAASQMSRTIDDLLSLAESGGELPEQSFSSVNVQELLSEVAEDVATLAAHKDVRVKCAVDDPKLALQTRKGDLKIVLLNVVRNAIAYSKSGKVVSLESKKVPNGICFEIKDSGIGISNADLPRIFDRFWRSDKARYYADGGNGLGLSIVRSIIDRHNGSIAVASVIDEGSTFTITLPDKR